MLGASADRRRRQEVFFQVLSQPEGFPKANRNSRLGFIASRSTSFSCPVVPTHRWPMLTERGPPTSAPIPRMALPDRGCSAAVSACARFRACSSDWPDKKRIVSCCTSSKASPCGKWPRSSNPCTTVRTRLFYARRRDRSDVGRRAALAGLKSRSIWDTGGIHETRWFQDGPTRGPCAEDATRCDLREAREDLVPRGRGEDGDFSAIDEKLFRPPWPASLHRFHRSRMSSRSSAPCCDQRDFGPWHQHWLPRAAAPSS